MIDETISHYKIIDKLGEGGMGVVYKAFDTKLRRNVALKFLASHALGTAEEKARFVREAQAAAGLDHPNICTIHEIDETDGHTYIAMAFVDGENLAERIESGPLEVEEGLAVAIDVARGLQKAHSENLVHRDIKSANIMLGRDGRARIADFGLAMLPGATRLTRTGTTVGTAAYMSPEQAIGEAVDHRSDIWSLGVVLHEMLTGQLPFKGEHQQAVAYQIVNEVPEPVTALRTGVPLELERVINKCLEKKPSERYQHADDLLVDLKKVETGLPARSRKRVSRYVVVASVLLVVAVGYFVPRGIDRPVRREGSTSTVKLAVLPFENLGSPEDEYFADGVTEEITSRLAAVRGLGVVARTSVMQYKDSGKGVDEIARELQVDYVLEGTVRWDRAGGNRVRVTPRLVLVADATQKWSQRYDRVIDDIFAVQSEIARRVIGELDVELRARDERSIESRPTKNIEAYQAYLRGLARKEFYDNDTALEMFERAVTLDPEFALGHAELSMAHSSLYHYGRDATDARLALAKASADRALEIEPGLAQGHLALGYYYYRGPRAYDRALEAFASAEKNLPNDPEILAMVGATTRRRGEFDAALEKFERTLEFDPQVSNNAHDLAYTHQVMRNYAEAERYFDRAIALSPDAAHHYLWKARNHRLWNGDLSAARAVLEKVPDRRLFEGTYINTWFDQLLYERDYAGILALAGSIDEPIVWWQLNAMPPPLLEAIAYGLMNKPELARSSYDSARVILEAEAATHPDDHRLHSALGIAYAGLGDREKAIRHGERGVLLFPVSVDALIGPWRVWDLGLIHAMLGEKEAALDQFGRALSIPCDFSVQILRLDPRLEHLRDSVGYAKLMSTAADR